MIDLIVFSGLVVLLILFSEMRKTVNALRDRVDELEAGTQEVAAAAPLDTVETVTTTKAEQPIDKPVSARRAAKAADAVEIIRQPAPEPVEPEAEFDEPPEPPVTFAKRFEDLIGGKLPIWIGGIALVFAGFFLVRFSIEAGLFGPTARCITAALFGLLLIGLSEFGHRIPKFGTIFNDDLRIGHSIAGAGIAVLYATLYMASELYGLMGLTSALIGVVAVTLLAFYLSQKHGPPTAIMGLLGGFAAPYVAGLGPESVAPLLIYLGVFTAGVFGLAIYRGWAWLALLATGGSAIWTTALLFLDITGDVPLVGAFITLLAIGGVLTISRAGTSFGIPKPFMQSIPLGVGLLQLITLAPLIEFSLMSWLFFGVLAIFTIALAWRDQTLTPAVGGALGLCLVMIALAFSNADADPIELYAAAGFAILFGCTGHFFALRDNDGWIWALVGLAAPTTMLPLTMSLAGLDYSDTVWGFAYLFVAATTALMAWRVHKSAESFTMPIATALTAGFLAIALWLWTPSEYAAIVAIIVTICLGFWTRFTKNKSIEVQATLGIVLAGILMLIPALPIAEAVLTSLGGETDLYSFLPDIGGMIIKLLVPAVTVLGFAYVFRDISEYRLSTLSAFVGALAASAFIYLLFKQPLAIGPMQQFVQYGFAERMVLTQLLVLSGWILLSRSWNESLTIPLKALGIGLAGIALFRFVYFDLLLLSPTNVKQAMGPAPVANLGTLHYTAAALWMWLFARSVNITTSLPRIARPLEIGTLLTGIAAVMVTIRQAVHGSDIATPPFTSTETYLYSAGLLVLAIAWLARGIQTKSALLRIAGLLLLTVITVKVFAFDANQLDGILRILSFLGLGIALIGIGWIYGKVMRSGEPVETETGA